MQYKWILYKFSLNYKESNALSTVSNSFHLYINYGGFAVWLIYVVIYQTNLQVPKYSSKNKLNKLQRHQEDLLRDSVSTCWPYCLIIVSFYFFSVDVYNGSNLYFWRLERKQMGAYLCIASNDVPPAVSKRIALNVNCKFSLSSFWIALWCWR